MPAYNITTDAEQTTVKTIHARNLKTAIDRGRHLFGDQASSGESVSLIIHDQG